MSLPATTTTSSSSSSSIESPVFVNPTAIQRDGVVDAAAALARLSLMSPSTLTSGK
jgi:hypothetical protein